MNWQSKFLFVALTIGLTSTAASFAQPIGNANTPPQAATQDDKIRQWFVQYDKIRRAAQMNPTDRQQADSLLNKGVQMMVPGPEKVVTQQLLAKLVKNNQNAANDMKNLQLYPELSKLHRGYYQYFNDAQTLFNDYLTVQNNLFAADANGKPIMGQLLARKQALEVLDQSNKALDAQLRAKYSIPPYQY